MVFKEFMSAIVLSLGGDVGFFESAIICSERAFSDAMIFACVQASMTSSVVSKFVRFVLSESCNELLMFLALSVRTDDCLPAKTPGESEDDEDESESDESDENPSRRRRIPNENPSLRLRDALVTM